MNRQKLSTGFVLIGTILFHNIFWSEQFGINTLLFTVFIIASFFIIFDKETISKEAILTSICSLLMASMIVINNSTLSIVMFGVSFLAMIGFVHQKELRFFLYGPFQSFLQLETIPKNLFGQKDELDQAMGSWKKGLVYARISILPLIVLAIFYGLYYSANPKFATYSDQAWTLFFDYFDWNISFERILFFLLGLFVVGAAIWKSDIPHLVRLNKTHSETLFRKRKTKASPTKSTKMLLLKKEFQTAILMMGMLNLLLLLVNVIDVRFVWFDFEEQPAYSLKNYVHEGTYLLIASILFAMSIIIYYFRGNLNFYSKNKTLQYFTYAWIFQNAILAYSVGMRNYRYIEYHGLAYKRIGVVIFLIAVIFGLITMFKKVQEQRSFYYLVNRNAWAVYILLIICSLVNWDVAITRYNIFAETKRPIDIDFLARDVSDKNLFLLEKYKHEIVKKLPPGYSSGTLEKLYKPKLERFKRKENQHTWLSWNYADYRNRHLLD